MKKLLIIIMSMILMVPTIAQGTQSVTNAAVALVSCGLD